MFSLLYFLFLGLSSLYANDLSKWGCESSLVSEATSESELVLEELVVLLRFLIFEESILSEDHLETMKLERSLLRSPESFTVAEQAYLMRVEVLLQSARLDWEATKEEIENILREYRSRRSVEKLDVRQAERLIAPQLVAMYWHHETSPLSTPINFLGGNQSSAVFFLGDKGNWSRLGIDGSYREGEWAFQEQFGREYRVVGSPIQVFNPKTQRTEGLQLVELGGEKKELSFVFFSLEDPSEFTLSSLRLEEKALSDPVYYTDGEHSFIVLRTREFNPHHHDNYIQVRLDLEEAGITRIRIAPQKSEGELFISPDGRPILVEVSFGIKIRAFLLRGEKKRLSFQEEKRMGTLVDAELSRYDRGEVLEKYVRSSRYPVHGAASLFVRRALVSAGYLSKGKIVNFDYRTLESGHGVGRGIFQTRRNPGHYRLQEILWDIDVPTDFDDLILFPDRIYGIEVIRGGKKINLDDQFDEKARRDILGVSKNLFNYYGDFYALVCEAGGKGGRGVASLKNVFSGEEIRFPREFNFGCVGELFQWGREGYAVIRDLDHHYLYRVY